MQRGPLAALLLIGCDSIQFAGSVARNDALPLMLFALGLERLLGTDTPGRWRMFIAGLALAAAASAKISYALPTAAVAIVLLVTEATRAPSKAASAYAGMALGGLPTLLFLALDPNRVWFQVVDYSVEAVRAFQTLNGSVEQLSVGRRLARFLKFAAMGALLPLLVGAFWALGKEEVRWNRLLVAVFVMALIAALLPMPMFRQYLVPFVAPAILMAAASGLLARMLALREPILTAMRLLFFAGALFRGTKEAGEAARAGESPIDTVLTAHAVGDLARNAGERSIASLDAVTATDTGLDLDRRFASGPFLFRAGNLSHCLDRSLCPLTFATVGDLDRAAPDALLTGSEAEEIGPLRAGLDGPLVDWAKAHGYRPQTVGKRVLWLRPPAVVKRALWFRPQAVGK